MSLETGLSVDSSPEILCVSDGRETTAQLREAVASCRPPETIETTTDPTVVPDLVAVWGVDCVVADADMQPLDGREIRSTVREINPTVSVIVVSVDPMATEPAVSVTSESTTLSERLDRADSQRTDEPLEPDPQPGGRLDRLATAESQCELLSELDAVVSELPTVHKHRLWLSDDDGSLDLQAEPASSRTTVPPEVREAIDTGRPKQRADPNTTASEPASTDRPEPRWTVAYPLGDQGVLSVDHATMTPAVRNQLQQLATVAGVCLDYQSTIVDIEARFRETADRNRTLSQFARTVAHDLNSPLSVIYGRIELAATNESDAEMHLQAARNAAQRVDSLITDHLQSIEAVDADSESDREPVSIQTVAIQAWRIVDPSTARLQVEPQLETVEANSIRLQQLFENLIRNAIEHGSEESVGLGAKPSRDPHAVFDDDIDSVTVTIKPTEQGFAVCDDGPGVPPDERDEIFESGYTTTESGSGLGLHIVREIVDAHDWEISVAASQSGGARFEVDTQ